MKRKRAWIIQGVWGRKPLALPLHLVKRKPFKLNDWLFVSVVGIAIGYFFSGLFLN
jgi:hypothetical protein